MSSPDRHRRSTPFFSRSPRVDTRYLPLGCVLLQSDGHVVSVTGSFAEILGCKVTNLFGQDIHEFLAVLDHQPSIGLFSVGSSTLVMVRQTGERFLWSVHKAATGAALGGYYIGVLLPDPGSTDSETHPKHNLTVLGEATAGVAHEIGGTLGVIADSAELLLEESSFNGFSRRSLEIIRDESHRLGTLLQDILSFARSRPHNPSPQDCSKLVSQVVELFNRKQNPKKISLCVKAEANLPAILVDEGRIHQLFFNLIKNASDASPESGEVLILIRRAKFEHNLPAVNVVVIDQGEGIDSEHLDRIYEPFFSTKPLGAGTGLGLAIARSIVESHHGVLRINSKKGEGTRASVLLPVVQTKEARDLF